MPCGPRIGLCILAGILGCSSERERRVVTAQPLATAPVLTIDLEDRIEASGELLALQHAENVARGPAGSSSFD